MPVADQEETVLFPTKWIFSTPLDASEELSKLASKLIKQTVSNISFQEIEFENEFDVNLGFGFPSSYSASRHKRCSKPNN
jgi:hypothetical protein